MSAWGRYLWMVPDEPTFHRGYGEELLAVTCDGDLAASPLVRGLRARVTVGEAESVAFPWQIVMGFDGSNDWGEPLSDAQLAARIGRAPASLKWHDEIQRWRDEWAKTELHDDDEGAV